MVTPEERKAAKRVLNSLEIVNARGSTGDFVKDMTLGQLILDDLPEYISEFVHSIYPTICASREGDGMNINEEFALKWSSSILKEYIEESEIRVI